MARNPEVKQFYKEYKSHCVCAECGTDKDISLIHMDISTKKEGICEYAKNAPNLELFKQELEKCVALCDIHASKYKYDTHRDDFKDHLPASEWHNHIDLGRRTKDALALLLVGYDRALTLEDRLPEELIFAVFFPGNDKVLERVPPQCIDEFKVNLKLSMEELRTRILERRKQLKELTKNGV